MNRQMNQSHTQTDRKTHTQTNTHKHTQEQMKQNKKIKTKSNKLNFMETKQNGDHFIIFDPLTPKTETVSPNPVLLCALNCASNDVRGAHEKSI